MTHISVLIVTYNAADTIQQCLANIQPPIEVIVVDNASTDNTVAIIRQEFPAVRLITNTENVGFGAGNNQAAQIANGEYLVLVNPDLVVDNATVIALVDYLQEHPDVGMAGPRTVGANGRVLPTARPPYTPLRIVSRYYSLVSIWPGLVYYTGDIPTDVGWLQGSCIAISQRLYQTLGGFDEAFFLFMEDTDLSDRARQADWRVVYLPDVTVMHHDSATVSRYPLIRVRNYHRSPIIYYRKRGRRGAVWFLKAAFGFEMLSKTILRRLRNFRHRDPHVAAHAQAEWTVFREIWWY